MAQARRTSDSHSRSASPSALATSGSGTGIRTRAVFKTACSSFNMRLSEASEIGSVTSSARSTPRLDSAAKSSVLAVTTLSRGSKAPELERVTSKDTLPFGWRRAVRQSIDFASTSSWTAEMACPSAGGGDATSGPLTETVAIASPTWAPGVRAKP
eukprot:CAMPEP_0183477648 /NCGR_PEP_ID=MMETSP0370-20130417/168575_1 /TAXON_ID=268820 /ORGANISM="Peridinium aciculiferum, Strain PAER-2" /LENGTH=155 /DNA_ID=CAMNT_0025670565 /DNA_START=117 /DNA_END=584 /DNA_ORIENTATION=-